MVPTTTRIINALPQFEPATVERATTIMTTTPAVVELATASLNLLVSPDDPRMGQNMTYGSSTNVRSGSATNPSGSNSGFASGSAGGSNVPHKRQSDIVVSNSLPIEVTFERCNSEPRATSVQRLAD